MGALALRQVRSVYKGEFRLDQVAWGGGGSLSFEYVVNLKEEGRRMGLVW